MPGISVPGTGGRRQSPASLHSTRHRCPWSRSDPALPRGLARAAVATGLAGSLGVPIAVGDEYEMPIANQTAHIAIASYTAGGVTAGNSAAAATGTDQAANITAFAGHCAGSVAVRNRPRIAPDQTTHAAAAGHCGRSVAAGHTAGVVAGQATNLSNAGHPSRHAAAGNAAAIAAHQPPTQPLPDTLIPVPHIANVGILSGSPEQPAVVSFRPADEQVGNRMPVAVKNGVVPDRVSGSPTGSQPAPSFQ